VDEEIEIVKIILEQNYEQARFAGTERLWFTNFYMVLVAGVLTYFGLTKQSLTDASIWFVHLFMLLFTIGGGVVAAKDGVEWVNHIKKIEAFFEEKRYDTLKKYAGIPKHGGIYTFLKVRYVFVSFYILAFFFWLFLLLSSTSHIWN